MRRVGTAAGPVDRDCKTGSVEVLRTAARAADGQVLAVEKDDIGLAARLHVGDKDAAAYTDRGGAEMQRDTVFLLAELAADKRIAPWTAVSVILPVPVAGS